MDHAAANCYPIYETAVIAMKRRLGTKLQTRKTTTQVREGIVKIGRNEPCPCGSGEKYKRCCEGKENVGAWWRRLFKKRRTEDEKNQD